MSTIGAALDSLFLVLEIGILMTLVVLVVSIWSGVLSGNLKKSTVWRKPLILPSLAFAITIIVAMTLVPLPMSAYKGDNQIQGDGLFSAEFSVFETDAYEAEILVRVVVGSLELNERIEIYVNFSLEDILMQSLFINMTNNILDVDGGVTRSIILDQGTYNATVTYVCYLDGVLQEPRYIYTLIHQPVTSSFIRELRDWGSYQFLLTIACIFLALAGICVRGEDTTKIREEDIDEEPPRDGEVYGRKMGW